jgi:tetratricopeptide (TPR) repeat protein
MTGTSRGHDTANGRTAPELARGRRARTVLEQRIWQRRQTFEDFARYAEAFARQTKETGTLSVRHLKRLAAGRGDGGKPLGRPQQATARLLELIFGESIDELLLPPGDHAVIGDGEQDLRMLLRAASRVDAGVVRLLREQLNATRRLDRQLGAIVAHDEVVTKAEQVTRLMNHSLTPATREQLAAVLSELQTLAGWQALDLGAVGESWQQYERGKLAAREPANPSFAAHTEAGQAFVLIDLGNTTSAVELLADIRSRTTRTTDRALRAWLAAAHGETLAANGQRSESLQAFDTAAALLPDDPTDDEGPYLALDAVHLARWRGHALARVGDPEAVDVLVSALDQLDPTFTRAETALRVDLATAYVSTGEHDQARAHLAQAEALATDIGSARQQRRLAQLRSMVR